MAESPTERSTTSAPTTPPAPPPVPSRLQHSTPVADGRARVVIAEVAPAVDGGRFPLKRTLGDTVAVEATVFVDGHDQIDVMLLHRHVDDGAWAETPMTATHNDLWRASFTVDRLGTYQYRVEAWVDRFGTWTHDTRIKAEAGQDTTVEQQAGAALCDAAAANAEPERASALRDLAERIRATAPTDLVTLLDSPPAADLADDPAFRTMPITRSSPALHVHVDRERARFSAWYELFPRSCSPTPGRHGTLADCRRRLADIAEMGFDIVYLPPIHPIGTVKRKGPNNAPIAGPDDPGSPWAIGSVAGGHTAIHPQLGTLDDFLALRVEAERLGMELALDIAFQCAPDHPYVSEHPEWFRWRPDGTVQYAENPPKKYEDIYPFDFECDAWESLWEELRDVFLFWAEQGVRVFRVDNPHTKPFAFWEWVLAEVRRRHPEVIFLSEAFTRPALMYGLAKRGFSQSYTYFTWRNTGYELREYLTELTGGPPRHFFRANLWPNTPDILHEHLQHGGRPAFAARAVLAATLAASWGVYGPAFELCEHEPRSPGSEEYLDSEKYQIRHWALDDPTSLSGLLAQLNRIRRDNPALQRDTTLRFHSTTDDNLLCYSKTADDGDNVIVVVVNLDPHGVHEGMVDLDLPDLDGPYGVHDLLSDEHYDWHGRRNYVRLDPTVRSAHVLRFPQRVTTEQDLADHR